MTKKIFIWITAGMLCLMFLPFGCAKRGKEEKVVAKINDYEMTVADLEDEITYSPYAGLKEQNLDEILDLAIRKQILIQEAQRQGLDKQKSFMRTIERYWQQTLIKELLEKETKRVFNSVAKERQKEALNDWMEGLYKKAKIKIDKKVLEEMEER